MKLSTHIKTQGFTLVEVLVAMVVFAIGMLGLAGMQGIALKDNNDAYMRSQAVFFAYDMGDRIRANPAYWDALIIQPAGGAVVLAADQVIIEGFGVYPFCSTDDRPAGAVGAGPDPLVDCVNTQELAQYDWYRMRKDIMDALPNGALTISKEVDSDAIGLGLGGQFIIRIIVSWDMTNNAVSNITPSFTYNVKP